MPKTIYQWKKGARLRGDAQIVGEELESVGGEDFLNLTRPGVVAAARDAGSPLHSYFDWDDGLAAEKYRLEQAGYLMRGIETVLVPVELESSESSKLQAARAFLVMEDPIPHYEPIAVVMSDAEKRTKIVKRALGELEDWQKRYEVYEELAGMFAAIEAEKAKLE